MSPRPEVSEERKNQTLDAATAVFARLGFRQKRMDDDIASQPGFSKGTLDWYIKAEQCAAQTLLDPGIRPSAAFRRC
jgi:AcrR family transcriptional regulator